jgi:ribonuclease BN (tRNA processing enzyme)
VLATDYEHSSEPDADTDPALAAFAADADLLLYDSQYTDAQIPERRGFGHSTETAGLRLLQRSGARSIRFIHHDPEMTDSALLEREAAVLEYWSGINGIKTAETADLPAFAREGETILL